MRADNTVHLIAAASRRHELARSNAIRAIRELDATGTAVTFESVARAAGVSRSWLYTQPDIRGEVLRLRDLGRRAPGTPVPARHRPQPGTGPGQSAAAPPARPSPRAAPRRRQPPRPRAGFLAIEAESRMRNSGVVSSRSRSQP